MKLLFMGVSSAACCIGLGCACAGRRCRVSHMEAFDTTACVTSSPDQPNGMNVLAVCSTAQQMVMGGCMT